MPAIHRRRRRKIMSAPTLDSKRSNLETVVALAGLLERVERSGAPVGADQYQVLVQRLNRALGDALPVDALQAVLGSHPAAAELYENLHYAHAGLCRSPLEPAVAAEQLARDTLARIARR
jgi:hypothetical protein